MKSIAVMLFVISLSISGVASASEKFKLAECASLFIMSGKSLSQQGKTRIGNELSSKGRFFVNKGAEIYGRENFTNYSLDVMKSSYKELINSSNQESMARKLSNCNDLYTRYKG